MCIQVFFVFFWALGSRNLGGFGDLGVSVFFEVFGGVVMSFAVF